jgi:RND family efflux transporter MFP subunit
MSRLTMIPRRQMTIMKARPTCLSMDTPFLPTTTAMSRLTAIDHFPLLTMTTESIITFLKELWGKRPPFLRRPAMATVSAAAAFGVTGLFIAFILVQGDASADAGHAGHDNESEVTGQASQYPIVTVEKPRAADTVSVSVEAAGQVFAQQQADLYPLQDGVIQSLSADLGSRVKQGQVLATLRADQSQQQIAAEIAFKQKELEIARRRAVLQVDSHVKAAEQERNAELRKVDAQAVAADQELAVKLQKLDAQTVASQKEREAEITKIDAEIAGLKLKREQRLNAVNSAAYDLLDSLNEVLFTRSDGISNYFNNAPFDYFRRREIVMPAGMDREKFEHQLIEFERTVKAGASDPLAIITEATRIGQIGRQISLNMSQSPALHGEEIDRIRKEIAEVTDHVLEITTDLTEADSEVKSLEAEKQKILASAEQQTILLDAERNEANGTANQQKNQLPSEKDRLMAVTQQKIVEIQGQRKNADLDADIIAAEIVRLQQQMGAGRTIIAPFSGVITKRFLNAGESVTLEKPVFTLIDDRSKYIRFHVSEADLPFVRVGTTVTFSPTSAPSEQFSAVVKRIAQSVDTETRTIQVEADIPEQANADRILAQMTIRVQIPVSQDPSLMVVPEAALQLSGDSDTVWTVSPDVTAVEKKVEVSFIHGGYAYVKAGLTDKDWVIVKSPVDLTAGLAVDTKRP